ncbi:hypothetical protein BTW10_11530 [Chromohalobacter japonicus]|uniref:HTH lysR-type domain-containing protein n=1 Tax=Chromohalobacter japonicus TaxID=223900 RepID=A0A1Q8TBM7_9GAMM|nr:LysR family transcriptional regulator [Chromohalobacter japonicus]OLO11093.1 hypothetical protein BTW10_11530 [Chromohalobacter japonicus]
MCSSQTVLKKIKQRLNWDDLRFFYALADSESMTSAAKKLNVSYMTVSRRLEKLEETLHKELFVRNSEGFVLTKHGRKLYEKVQAMHDTAEQLVEDLGAEDVIQKKIRISTIQSLACQIVAPGLRSLQEKYSNLVYDIQVTDRNISIPKREADIAIRLSDTQADEENTFKLKLGRVNYYLCGTEPVIRAMNAGETVSAITFNEEMWQLQEVKHLLKTVGLEKIGFQSNSSVVQRSAAIAGYGVVLLPDFMIEDTELCKSSEEPEFSKDIWLVTKKQSYELTAVRLVIEELVSAFEKYSQWDMPLSPLLPCTRPELNSPRD